MYAVHTLDTSRVKERSRLPCVQSQQSLPDRKRYKNTRNTRILLLGNLNFVVVVIVIVQLLVSYCINWCWITWLWLWLWLWSTITLYHVGHEFRNPLSLAMPQPNKTIFLELFQCFVALMADRFLFFFFFLETIVRQQDPSCSTCGPDVWNLCASSTIARACSKRLAL